MSLQDRDQQFVERLHQIYKIIKHSNVIRSGQFYVDTDRDQTNIYFVDRSTWCISKFSTYLSDDQIESLFSIIDTAFKQGVEIGLRESFNIIVRQLCAIIKGDFEHLSKKQLLSYALEGITDAYVSTHDGRYPLEKTQFMETLSFIKDNKKCIEANNFDAMILSILDYSFNGDSKYYYFSPEKMIETLDRLNAQPRISALDKRFARKVSQTYL